jgi:hypothetical protein
MLEENGAKAIRVYRNGRGYGRAWVAPYCNGHVVFNGYGEQASTFAEMLATINGLSYKRVSLRNNGSETGELWINGGRGYYVAPADEIAQTTYDAPFDLGWDEVEDDGRECNCCGCNCDEEDGHYIDDEFYCSSCANDNYCSCARCGEWVANDYATCVNDEWYCESCRDRLFTKCDDCGEYVDSTTTIGDDEVCQSCLENGDYSTCEKCGEWCHVNDLTDIDGNTYCDDCKKDLPITCSHCGERRAGTTTIDGAEYCEDCKDDLFEFRAEFGVYTAKVQLILA